MCGSEAKKGSCTAGSQREGQGGCKEGTQTDQILIQTRVSSDQILAVKTEEEESSSFCSILCRM